VRLGALAGALGGLALAFKIVAGLYVIALSIVFAIVLLRDARLRREAVRPALGFILAGIAAGSPWLLLRWAETGNPVFPLFNRVFKSDMWPAVNERFDLFLYGIGTTPSDLVSIWWEATLHPWLFGQGAPPWLFGLPFLASLAFLLWLPAIRRNRGGMVWVGFAFAAFLAWFWWSQYHRYGLPPAALLALPAAAALVFALRQFRSSAWPLALVPLLVVWFAAGIANGFASNYPEDYPTDVLLQRETREQYRQRVIPDYLPLRFLEERTAGTSDQAFIFGFPYNYFVANPVWDSILPPELSPPRRIAEAGLTGRPLAAALLEARVRYLVIDYNLAANGTPEWLAASLMDKDFLAGYTKVRFDRFNVLVYEVVVD
jgi:hypothetical protein